MEPELPEILREPFIGSYKCHGKLGSGGQADVYLCSQNQNFYAAKIYDRRQGNIFRDEVQILSQLSNGCPYVIQFIESNELMHIKLPYEVECTRPVSIMEEAEEGDFWGYIAHGESGRLPIEVCRTIAKQLLEAVEFIHEKGFTHGDLKLQNILLGKNFILKIADLGFASRDGVLFRDCGTKGYRAPEIEKISKEGYLGLNADLFAVGVIIFIIYVGGEPFCRAVQKDKEYRYFFSGKVEKFWEHWESKRKIPGLLTEEFQNFMNSFFTIDIKNRHTFETIKNSAWLNGPQASQEEVENVLRPRKERIFNNEVELNNTQIDRMNILQQWATEQNQIESANNSLHNENTVQLFLNNAEENQNNLLLSQNNTEATNGTRSLTIIKSDLPYQYISSEDFPYSDQCRSIPLKIEPAIVLAWLQLFLREAFNNNDTFLQESDPYTLPSKYHISYNEEDKKVYIHLIFKEIIPMQTAETTEKVEESERNELKDRISSDEEEDEEFFEELNIEGQFIKLRDDRISINWKKLDGKELWIYRVIWKLNEQLRLIQALS